MRIGSELISGVVDDNMAKVFQGSNKYIFLILVRMQQSLFGLWYDKFKM